MNQCRMSCCLCEMEASAVVDNYQQRTHYFCSSCGEFDISHLAASNLAKTKSSKPNRIPQIQAWIKLTPNDQFLSVSFNAPKQELEFERVFIKMQ